MELGDSELTLRPPLPTDIDWIVQACRDLENQRWLPMLPRPYSRSDAEWWLGRCRQVWADGSAAPFIVVDSTSGERLGTIELRLGGDAGYRLLAGAGRPGARRHDAGAAAVVRYAFEERGVAQVELFTLLDNVALPGGRRASRLPPRRSDPAEDREPGRRPPRGAALRAGRAGSVKRRLRSTRAPAAARRARPPVGG